MSATSPGSGSLVYASPSVPMPPQTYPPTANGNKLCEEDRKVEWEQEFRETFSKSILKLRIAEYVGGKYTKRYIQTYLDFMVLSGMVNNLEYLEFKNLIIAGEPE